jgi:hypothetical protein
MTNQPKDKALLLRMAQTWQELAERVARQQDPDKSR